MEESLISFNTAKLAKEKGFNIQTQSWYTCRALFVKGWFGQLHKAANGIYPSYYACSQSILQEWLRSIHNIEASVVLNHADFKRIYERQYNTECLRYSYRVSCNINNKEFIYKEYRSELTFDSYKEALEECLIKALSLI